MTSSEYAPPSGVKLGRLDEGRRGAIVPSRTRLTPELLLVDVVAAQATELCPTVPSRS